MADYEGGGDYGHQNGGMDTSGRPGGHDDGSGSAVFISNLQWWTTDAEIETLCAAYGRVANIRFIDDKVCGKSRGMAIVDFDERDAAAACISGLNGRDINGRPCRVSFQQQRSQQGGGSGSRYGDSRGSSMGGRGGGRGGGGRGMGGRGGGRGGGGMGDDLGGSSDLMAAGGAGMMGGMLGPGGVMVMPGMMPGMMGMAMPGMDMMQSMQGMMVMPGMMAPMMQGMGMAGMPGFKPPPPPGGPPKKE